MRKIFTSLLFSMTMIMATFSNTYAFEESAIEKAYNNVVSYYQKVKSLESPDEIMAVEALGLEAEEGYELPDLESQDFESLSLGDLSKSIIALTLIQKDPTSIQGIDLVALLESNVHDDGSIQGSYGSSTDIWVLFALESVSSNKTDIVAKHLSEDNNTDGGFWYEYNGKWSSPDTTGWGIEALTIAGQTQYAESINKALNYIQTQQRGNGVYGYSANADTQSCVLEGLFAYDKDLVLNGTYDQDGVNPIEVLLSFQLEDGSFKSEVYDENWNATGEYTFNAYTTLESARCLGTYKNGSFVEKAKKEFSLLKQALSVSQVKEGESIELQLETTTISKEILEAAKGKDIDLVVKEKDYTWVINGKNITSTKDIDLGVQFDTHAIDENRVKNVAKDNESKQISLNYDGDFGFKATLQFNVGEKNANKSATLYYNDNDLKEIYHTKVDNQGNVSLEFTHASDYLLVLSEDQTNEKAPNKDVVQTSDESQIMMYVSLLLLSAIVYMKGRKDFE